MRFTILLCVAGLLAAGPVFGEARDTLRLKIAPPRVMVPETVVLTDSIPGAFIEKLDALYEMWYVTKHGGEGDGGLFYEPEGGQVSMPDSVYLARLDSLNSAIRLSYNDIVRNYIEVYVVRGRAQSGVLLGLSDYYFPIFGRKPCHRECAESQGFLPGGGLRVVAIHVRHGEDVRAGDYFLCGRAARPGEVVRGRGPLFEGFVQDL